METAAITASTLVPAVSLDDGAVFVIRPAGRSDVARLAEVSDDVTWPTLDLDPPDRADALPGADGTEALLLLALDASGTCLGLASYERAVGGSSATLALDVSPRARGRGVAATLVRSLGTDAARHGIATLEGWLQPAEGRELVTAPRPLETELLAVVGGCWHVVVPVVDAA